MNRLNALRFLANYHACVCCATDDFRVAVNSFNQVTRTKELIEQTDDENRILELVNEYRRAFPI